MLIVSGIILVILGVWFQFQDKIPFLGKLPGDIAIKGEKYAVYFPITSGILVSLLLSLGLYLARKIGEF
ncbi:MAG: DUF2905 domain-containing protein [Cytophagales bacterium]|nr:DUF2905 domain-containing protein [Cytophagales bacterium]